MNNMYVAMEAISKGRIKLTYSLLMKWTEGKNKLQSIYTKLHNYVVNKTLCIFLMVGVDLRKNMQNWLNIAENCGQTEKKKWRKHLVGLSQGKGFS